MSATGIYGLSGSGIDVESMVKVGMMSKQNQYDKMYKQEVKNEWTKEAYTSLYSDMNTFKDSTLYNYKLSSATNAQSAASTDANIASATANADAASMSHTVKVTSVASNAYVQSASAITRNNTASPNSIYLKDVIAGSTELSADDYANLSAEEKDKKRNEVALSFYISDGDPADANTTTSAITFTYKELFEDNQTLNDLASKIKSSSANFTASYDATNNSFSIYQKNGGTDNKIVLSVPNRTIAETELKTGITTNAKADDAARTLLNNLHLAQVKDNAMSDEITFSETSDGVGALSGTGSLTSNGSETYTNDTKLTDLLADVGTNGLSFTVKDGVNAKTLTYTAETASGKTVKDLIKDINGLGMNVTASLGSDGKLVLANSDSTKDVSLAVDTMDTSDTAKTSRTFLNNMFGTSGTNLRAGTTSTSASIGGTNGSVTIDGKDYTTTGSKVTVANVSYTLNGVGTTTVSVSQNTDKIIDNVKQFVTDYNKMIDALNDKYYETKYSDYDVLTKSQESAMTKDQIDKWNEKAKSGLLYHDQTLGKIISSMREAIYTPVDSVDSNYNSMMAIGITSSTNRGHLTLDEDKLKEALAADPDCVYQIFASSGDVTNSATGETETDYNKEGVMNRISDKFNSYLKEMKSYAGTTTEAGDGSTLGTLIQQLQTKMSDFKTTMDAYETLLYKKYDSMESMIQQLTMQANYITGS